VPFSVSRVSVIDSSASSSFRNYAGAQLDCVRREGVGENRRKFDKWDATLKFTSPEETTGLLEIIIQAASVDTGSGLKNGKLKSKDFFDVENFPVITFKSTKIVKTGHETYEVDGDFTIRGVSNPEKLTLRFPAREQVQARLKGKWSSIVRTME
jgi:polyisoprenoid-binding protein YceI